MKDNEYEEKLKYFIEKAYLDTDCQNKIFIKIAEDQEFFYKICEFLIHTNREPFELLYLSDMVNDLLEIVAGYGPLVDTSEIEKIHQAFELFLINSNPDNFPNNFRILVSEMLKNKDMQAMVYCYLQITKQMETLFDEDICHILYIFCHVEN